MRSTGYNSCLVVVHHRCFLLIVRDDLGIFSFLMYVMETLTRRSLFVMITCNEGRTFHFGTGHMNHEEQTSDKYVESHRHLLLQRDAHVQRVLSYSERAVKVADFDSLNKMLPNMCDNKYTYL